MHFYSLNYHLPFCPAKEYSLYKKIRTKKITFYNYLIIKHFQFIIDLCRGNSPNLYNHRKMLSHSLIKIKNRLYVIELAKK